MKLKLIKQQTTTSCYRNAWGLIAANKIFNLNIDELLTNVNLSIIVKAEINLRFGFIYDSAGPVQLLISFATECISQVFDSKKT